MSFSLRKVASVSLLISICLVVGCQSSIPATSEEVPRIQAAELWSWLDKGKDVTVVDTRGIEEFEAVHIPDAISMPYEDVEERYIELPRTGEIVFY